MPRSLPVLILVSWLAKQICYARTVIMQRSSVTNNIAKTLASYRAISHLFKKQYKTKRRKQTNNHEDKK